MLADCDTVPVLELPPQRVPLMRLRTPEQRHLVGECRHLCLQLGYLHNLNMNIERPYRTAVC